MDGSKLCPCIYGFHDQDKTLLTCLKCHHSCLTCTNSLTCSSCFAGRIPVVSSTCACPLQRFYDNMINGACIPCHFSCLTCSGLSSVCTSCSVSSNRELLNTSCICKIGFFSGSIETCTKCHYSCKSCIN